MDATAATDYGPVYHAVRWLLEHGVTVGWVASLLAIPLALLGVAYLWMMQGARTIAAVWVWRQAIAWWRSRGRAPFGHPGGAGGRSREHSPEYEAVMQSTGWRRRRAQAIRRAGRRCAWCGARGRLDVHHLTYQRLGREAPGDVVALCEACHRRAHAAARYSGGCAGAPSSSGSMGGSTSG